LSIRTSKQLARFAAVSGPERPGPALQLTQLLPEAKTTTVGELLGSLHFGARALADRPYVVVNFVASVDGRTAFGSRSAALSDLGDRAMFHGLRESADAVFAGTATIRDESYGRLVRDPERRSRRAAAGLRPDPLACVMTRSGEVPTSIPLFADPDSRIVVFTPVAVDLSGVRAHVEVVRLDPGQLTLTTMVRRLRSDYGVRSLLCEGGATVFGAMLSEGVVDELFLTLAPKLAGGDDGPGVTSGPELPELVPLRLVWALEREGSLFLRYALE
jgi:5-amino-6-(5-phosphoribosylamino)uracil reductase